MKLSKNADASSNVIQNADLIHRFYHSRSPTITVCFAKLQLSEIMTTIGG